MRYYLVLLSYSNGNSMEAYQEIDSNGQLRRYTTLAGQRYLPEEIHECKIVSNQFQFPNWRKIDWTDLLNGGKSTGLWAITEK
jgi:hypothetical protein